MPPPTPKTFAKNVMEIAVPPANPGKVTGVSSLASADVKTALCQPQVPCGATAAKVFTNAKITVTPVTLEPDVKSVLSKVQLGEVDAGVVYVTDVLAAGDKVKGVRDPRRRQRLHQLPDRRADQERQRRDGGRVRRLRAVAGRGERAGRRRLPEALTATAVSDQERRHAGIRRR